MELEAHPMDYQSILDRVLATADQRAYLTPVRQVDVRFVAALTEVHQAIHATDFNVERARLLVQRLHDSGRLDRVHYYSALHVIAAAPQVRDYAEAARMVAAQEMAALELGGPNLDTHLASVDRHRGVLAFLQSQYGVALDYFTRSLERERSSENLGNILCALLRLGEHDEAVELLQQIRHSFPANLVDELEDILETDPDLMTLRSE
jgi:tetratricopeptide (TPR) repeat protein